jgi:hypothetical protein
VKDNLERIWKIAEAINFKITARIFVWRKTMNERVRVIDFQANVLACYLLSTTVACSRCAATRVVSEDVDRIRGGVALKCESQLRRHD